MRSVLQANGASPFTLSASAISTCQPASSSRSWTKRAPFIDSIAALSGWPCPASRRASERNPSASGGATPTSTRSPDSSSRQKSRRLRLRSNPACNIELGPPLGNPHRTSRSLPAEEALLHRIPYHGSVLAIIRGHRRARSACKSVLLACGGCTRVPARARSRVPAWYPPRSVVCF